MEIVMTKDELKNLLKSVAEIAVQAYKAEERPKADRISQRTAFHLFGRDKVQEWERNAGLKRDRSGEHKNSTIYYSKLDLQILQASEKQQILN